MRFPIAPFILAVVNVVCFLISFWSVSAFALNQKNQASTSDEGNKQRTYHISTHKIATNQKTQKSTHATVKHDHQSSQSKNHLTSTTGKVNNVSKTVAKPEVEQQQNSEPHDSETKAIKKSDSISDESNKIASPEAPTQQEQDSKLNVENDSEKLQKNSDSLRPKAKSMSKTLWQSFSAADLGLLKEIMHALQEKKYDEAAKLANQVGLDAKDSDGTSLRDAVSDVVLWNKFSGNINHKKTAFGAIANFAIDNPFLPNIKEIRRNVEAVAIANATSFQSSERYFATYPPLDSESKLFVVESKINSMVASKKSEQDKDYERKILQAQIVKIWIKENLSIEEEEKFLEKYREILTENDHIERIERLLWDNRVVDAMRILSFINSDHQSLFRAIIKIAESPHYIDNFIISVPRKLRTNELLVYRVVLWYKAKDRFDELIELMTRLPSESKFADKWWPYRRLYGREMIKRKDFDKAYKIISRHNLPSNSVDFWEAEWTAGWVALRFVDDKNSALKHFVNLQKNVAQPVTLSRANYWLGMTYQAMGNKSKAIEWYKKAATYPTFFYGQLAIHKHRTIDPLNAANDIILPKNPDITGRDIFKISESRAAQIAYILAITGDKDNASKIFEWIVQNAPTDGQIAVIMKIINELGDRQLDAKISRIAAKKNVFFVRDKFQIVKEVSKDEYAPLVHAIIKQESGFAPSALSKVGAIGFMQLMPETAKLVAREMGAKYDKKKLATDIQYNVLLGSFYIKKLLNQFDNSEMLAIASYNAGPNATLRWINEFYDPRKEKDHDKVVDWIELITYSETRNYVQRIIENMIVYKYLMSRSNYDELQ